MESHEGEDEQEQQLVKMHQEKQAIPKFSVGRKEGKHNGTAVRLPGADDNYGFDGAALRATQLSAITAPKLLASQTIGSEVRRLMKGSCEERHFSARCDCQRTATPTPPVLESRSSGLILMRLIVLSSRTLARMCARKG